MDASEGAKVLGESVSTQVSRDEQLASELGFGRRLWKIAKIPPCTHYLEIG